MKYDDNYFDALFQGQQRTEGMMTSAISVFIDMLEVFNFVTATLSGILLLINLSRSRSSSRWRSPSDYLGKLLLSGIVGTFLVFGMLVFTQLVEFVELPLLFIGTENLLLTRLMLAGFLVGVLIFLLGEHLSAGFGTGFIYAMMSAIVLTFLGFIVVPFAGWIGLPMSAREYVRFSGVVAVVVFVWGMFEGIRRGY